VVVMMGLFVVFFCANLHHIESPVLGIIQSRKFFYRIWRFSLVMFWRPGDVFVNTMFQRMYGVRVFSVSLWFVFAGVAVCFSWLFF